MSRTWIILKNKYLLSGLFVLVYILLLHDTDVVTLVRRHDKVEELEMEAQHKRDGIADLKIKIAELQSIRSLEKYARETHYFKKADEDLFIFSFE
jgi:cell division protein FtsB